MGYLKFGLISSPDGNLDDFMLNSSVLTVRRHTDKQLDLIYDLQFSTDQGYGQVRLQSDTDWTSENIAIINDAVVTAQSQDFVNVQLNDQKIVIVDINPQNP
tara:strand:+ start:207 stop:512 length:306 start_codon:yes stop_codon:yes gene_type:complete